MSRLNGWTSIARVYSCLLNGDALTVEQLAEEVQLPVDWVTDLLEVWGRAQAEYLREVPFEAPPPPRAPLPTVRRLCQRRR